jgi:hypothetical protein
VLRHDPFVASDDMHSTGTTDEGESEISSESEGGGGDYSPPQSTVANESTDDPDEENNKLDPMYCRVDSDVGAGHANAGRTLKRKVSCECLSV